MKSFKEISEDNASHMCNLTSVLSLYDQGHPKYAAIPASTIASIRAMVDMYHESYDAYCNDIMEVKWSFMHD